VTNLVATGTASTSNLTVSNGATTSNLSVSLLASTSNLIVGQTATSGKLVTLGTTTLALNGGTANVGYSALTYGYGTLTVEGRGGLSGAQIALTEGNANKFGYLQMNQANTTVSFGLYNNANHSYLTQAIGGILGGTYFGYIQDAGPATDIAKIGYLSSFGTTTSYARLTVWATSTSFSERALDIVSSASTSLFTIFNNGQASSTNLIVSGTATTSALVVTGSGTTSFSGPIAVTGATSSFSGLRLSSGCLQDSTGACVGRGQGATYVVAASSSIYRNYADYVATGTNDQNVINNAITAAYSAARGAGGKMVAKQAEASEGGSGC
jgi:hypothetical protein